mmetsp:Transcript_108148/g.345396  ORF Transcript_108148/g.345396 Transcript_108148/m.345396 type:complete len:388 (-) Transcript_108148:41-1204(-)
MPACGPTSFTMTWVTGRSSRSTTLKESCCFSLVNKSLTAKFISWPSGTTKHGQSCFPSVLRVVLGTGLAAAGDDSLAPVVGCGSGHAPGPRPQPERLPKVKRGPPGTGGIPGRPASPPLAAAADADDPPGAGLGRRAPGAQPSPGGGLQAATTAAPWTGVGAFSTASLIAPLAHKEREPLHSPAPAEAPPPGWVPDARAPAARAWRCREGSRGTKGACLRPFSFGLPPGVDCSCWCGPNRASVKQQAMAATAPTPKTAQPSTSQVMSERPWSAVFDKFWSCNSTSGSRGCFPATTVVPLGGVGRVGCPTNGACDGDVPLLLLRSSARAAAAIFLGRNVDNHVFRCTSTTSHCSLPPARHRTCMQSATRSSHLLGRLPRMAAQSLQDS